MKLIGIANRFAPKTSGRKLAKGEICWPNFLQRLKSIDRENINTLIARLGEVNKEVPLAVVAVGSTLSGKKAYYNDIDLILLPLHPHNIGLAELVFTKFAQNQPEARKKAGTDEPEELETIYDFTTSWYLDFSADSAPIHLIIREDGRNPVVAAFRVALDQFMRQQTQWYSNAPFSIYSFNDAG